MEAVVGCTDRPVLRVLRLLKLGCPSEGRQVHGPILFGMAQGLWQCAGSSGYLLRCCGPAGQLSGPFLLPYLLRTLIYHNLSLYDTRYLRLGYMLSCT